MDGSPLGLDERWTDFASGMEWMYNTKTFSQVVHRKKNTRT
jgi:hypothetical protein